MREANSPVTPLVIQLARLVFKNKFLETEFSQDIFLQMYGIAMGTPFSAANAFMYYLEKDLVSAYRNHISLYKRFIDDIIMLWSGPYDKLLEFLNVFNTKDPRINLTYEISDKAVTFLDLYIHKVSVYSLWIFSSYQQQESLY